MPLPVTSATPPETETILNTALALVGVSTGSTSVQWSVISGPGGPSAGNATFDTPTQGNVNVTFKKIGIYIIQFKGTNISGFTLAFVNVSVFGLSAVPGPNPVINTENP